MIHIKWKRLRKKKENTSIEQVSKFEFLGCVLSQYEDLDMEEGGGNLLCKWLYYKHYYK
jgi:hypothetical protein